MNHPLTPGNLNRVGHGNPAAGLGLDGDTYKDLDSGKEWYKTGGAWGIILSDIDSTTTGTLPVSRVVGAVKITTSSWAGGPPASPSDKDIWIATGVDANGTRWQFQYNAGSASSFKWEFIGGPPVWSIVSAFESTASATPADLTTAGPSFTATRGGDYVVRYGATSDVNSAASVALTSLFTNAGVRVTGGEADAATVGVFTSAASEERVAALVAGTTYKLRYWASNGTTATFANRWLSVVPIRIA